MKLRISFFFACCWLFSGIKAHTEPPVASSVISADSATDIIYDKAEVTPDFPGGFNALMQFIGEHLVYPATARDAGFEGKVIVKFYIDTDGSVKEPVILRNDGCPECADEVLRVVSKFPKWSPGLSKSNPVKVYYSLPIILKLGNSGTDINNKKPIYRGDEIQLQDELLDGIRVLNKTNKANHSINIMFTVSETGSVSNVSIESLDLITQQQLDKIKKQMEESKWYPAVKNGKIVAVSHSININY